MALVPIAAMDDGAILLSALVAHSAWHWMTGRGGQLLAYDWTWPSLDASFALAVTQALLLLLVAAGAAWILGVLVKRVGTAGRTAGDIRRAT